MNHLGLFSTKDMSSGRVTDQLGEPMGGIKEFLFDPETGRMAMVVLGWGGVLGVGDTTRLVPWEAFTFLPNSGNFQLNIDRRLVDSAPEMTADDARESHKVKEAFKHFGITPSWETPLPTTVEDAAFQSQPSDTHQPAYRNNEETNSHQQYEGSYQVSQPYFRSDEDNKLREELDLDKIKGMKPNS
jgi:hypothetical protein